MGNTVRVDFAEARVYPDTGVLVRGWFSSRVYKLGTALLNGQNLTLKRWKYSTGASGNTCHEQRVYPDMGGWFAVASGVPKLGTALLDGQNLTLKRRKCSRAAPGNT